MTTERDRRNQLKKALEDGLKDGREKGLAEGREKGLAEGREKGLAEGREKGLAEGRAEGLAKARAEAAIEQEALKKEIARNLIKTGLSDNEIAVIVPLPLEEIQDLRS